jgi:CheY-like chemotaxis protein
MSQTTILIVDDEAPMRKLLATNLKASGYTVRPAADGLQAMQLLESTSSTCCCWTPTCLGATGCR